MRICTVLVGAMIAAVLAGGGCAGRFQSASAVTQRAQRKVFPTLVFIKPLKQHYGAGELRRHEVFGSGAIISPDGLVVTNSHVAIDSTSIKCVLYSGEQFNADLVGVDTDTDLALLRLKLPEGHGPLPTAQFGDSDRAREGEFVMAFGSPFGLSRSISFGVVSSARRYLDIGPYNLWIQTDAAINPGNSGGPLVNERGQIIGINTIRFSSADNIGFAIPSNTVRDVLESLRVKGRVERSYNGIQFQPLKDFLRDVMLDHDAGVLVGGVDPLSPAAEAGLLAGDLIVRVAGEEVKGVLLEDLPAVRRQFARLTAGEPATMEVRRGAETVQIALTPAEKSGQASEQVDLELWNCSVQAISKFKTPALAYFAPNGVHILGVRNPGNAQAAGLRPGDIILKVNEAPVQSLADLQEIYRGASLLDPGKRTVLLQVLRSGYLMFIVLDFNRDVTSWNE